MMASNKIELSLNDYSNVYYPGQTILGEVECFFTTEQNFRSVKIAYTSKAETKWTEKEKYYDENSKHEKTREVKYSDEEVYFNMEYVLADGGDSSRPPIGTQKYPFTYVLPHGFPSSFEGMYGSVRYTIKAVIDPPSRPDHEARITINVASPLDLNRIPNLREPVATLVDSTPCSFWCQNSGPITLTMSLATTGFVAGREINIGANVENMSNINVENVIFKLVAKYEYIAQEHRNFEEKVIAECTEGAIGAHGDKLWTPTLTIVPDIPVPNLLRCNLINVNYVLKAKVVLPFPHDDLLDELKVMIGTVPLSGTNYPGPPPLQNNSDCYTPTAPLNEAAVNASSSFRDINMRITQTPSQPGYAFPVEGVLYASELPPYIAVADLSPAPPSYDEAHQLKSKDTKLE